ncbi:MAG TPA: cysteine desulfurase NifS [Candidatus Omnitrophica bacterium]|nr:cysteine desulfurase NifS [Candidatus Omnitrophota bacterium]
MKKIYMDYAATTPVDPEVLKEMQPYFCKQFGNPSSLHSYGQKARKAVESVREKIGQFLNASPDEIVFTSGGTESNNFAIKGIAYANKERGNHIITSVVEHHAVIEPCKYLENQGFEVTYLKVDKNGFVNPDDVKEAIKDRTILISIMHANNEIGTIQPIAEIGKIAKERGIYFHTDAVQTFGHLNIDVDEMNVDLLSASAHKLYGPKGVGFLYIRKGTRIIPFLHGGDQEKGRRASTHNVPGIIGLGKAVELARKKMKEENVYLKRLRDKLITGVMRKIEETILNGPVVDEPESSDKRLPNNVNFGFKYIEGESLVLSLDMKGICASTGSACSSQSLEPSHVLLAIGLPPEIAHGSLRLTLGRYTEEGDVDYVLKVLPEVVSRLRSMSPLYRAGRDG